MSQILTFALFKLQDSHVKTAGITQSTLSRGIPGRREQQ